MSVVSRGLAHFDLTASHPNLQGRLSMHGWPVSHVAIVKGKSRGVIWTFNTVTEQFTFRKRLCSAKTSCSQRMHRVRCKGQDFLRLCSDSEGSVRS